MMTREKLTEINGEIIAEINVSLNRLAIDNPKDYVLLLADGEYNEILTYNRSLDLSPYMISSKMDRYDDASRLKFLCEFLNKYYTFQYEEMIEDDMYRFHIELMIYTHLWESKPFLKKIYRLARLIDNNEYNWKIKIPAAGNNNKRAPRSPIQIDPMESFCEGVKKAVILCL